jgi:hypothetical protein
MAILREYANAFTTILKAKSWCRGCCYVDAFAARGAYLKKNGGNGAGITLECPSR